MFGARLVTRFCTLAYNSARLGVGPTVTTLEYSARMSSSHNKDRGGKGRGKGYGGRRGGRQNDPDVELSKALSYILRHGAQREGLAIRSDGYMKLDDLVSAIPEAALHLEPKSLLTLTHCPVHDWSTLSYADPSSEV
jgi:hypothetical protein